MDVCAERARPLRLLPQLRGHFVQYHRVLGHSYRFTADCTETLLLLTAFRTAEQARSFSGRDLR